MYSKYIKRILDVLLSLTILVFFWWLILIVAILVRIFLGSPVIFKQQRPGKDGKIFTLYKFRTMTDEKDENGNLLPDEDRLNKFGKFLRSTSLDELPEMINILKGEMSFVGPRPLLVQYLELYNDEQRHRHDVRPGLTGLAQVNGRNETTWEDRFKYDLEYINNVTFKNDISIIFRTLKLVFTRQGVSSNNSVTMEKFKGTSEKKGINMKKKLLIIGASGHGKVAADIAKKMNMYHEISFFDDCEEIKKCMQFSVIGKVKDVYNYLEEADVFVAVGNSEVRKNILMELKNNKASIATLIHPEAVIGENVTIDVGTIVMAGAVINPDTKIGEGCIVNTSASVDHDCQVGDYVHVSVGAHLAGNVSVEENTWIGVGVSVINNVSICKDVMLGAGTVVVKDIIEKGTYVGVPAKKMIK